MAYTTINKSTDHFNTKIYTGTGSSNALTGVGFQPDWTWIKSRSNTYSHSWTDAVRGLTKVIASNTSNDQYTSSTEITSFNSDGFTVGTDAGVNNNGSTFASWNWKANGQGSSNTDGSINTTYTSVNNTSGFSISSFTGTGSNATIGTGLTSKPACVIIKNLTDNGTEWMIGHQGLATNAFSSNKYIHFNTAVTSTNSSSWNSTEPTSNGIVSLGDGSYANGSGKNHICYAFTEKQGFSKFGSYVGNGEPGNDAPFIYTGFKPAFVLLKSSTYAESWSITDNRRLGYNGSSAFIKADASQAEATDLPNPDFLSNGFKLQTNDNVYNKNTQTYIYMAFAEAPLVGSNNIPATAR